jgi:hypothetical protein
MSVSNKTKLNFSSGPISFSEIRRIFVENTTQPLSFSQVYRDTNLASEDPVVPDAAENAAVPTSGTIQTSNFRDTLKAYTLEQTGTDLNLKIHDYFNLFDSNDLAKNVRKNFQVTGTVASNATTSSALEIISQDVVIRNFAIVNDGDILGAGGAIEANGGDAIRISTISRIKIVNNGNIWAGGGGGGRGGSGGKGGTGGGGYYNTFINRQCSNFINKQCYRFVNKQCSNFINKQCSNFIAKTCYRQVTKTDYKSPQWLGGCPGSYTCSQYKSVQQFLQNGKVQLQRQVQVCTQCSKTTNEQKPYDCSTQQVYDCSTQQVYDCSFQQVYDCSYQQSYDCSYQQTTYTSGGGGGSGGSGGSAGRGRGYNWPSPNSISSSSGQGGSTGSSGGTNAGSGGAGGTGGAGGAGGDWGQDGTAGSTGDTGSTGQSGNNGGGTSGSSGSSGNSAGIGGNYILGTANAVLVNNNSVKGRTRESP